jgi:hypothetical protein
MDFVLESGLSITRRRVDEFTFSAGVDISSRLEELSMEDGSSFAYGNASVVPSAANMQQQQQQQRLQENQENTPPRRRMLKASASMPSSSSSPPPRRTLGPRSSSLKSSKNRRKKSAEELQKQNRRFSEQVEVFEIPPRTSFQDYLDDMFYTDEDIAEFRNDAFMESCGLSSCDFEEFDAE